MAFNNSVGIQKEDMTEMSDDKIKTLGEPKQISEV